MTSWNVERTTPAKYKKTIDFSYLKIFRIPDLVIIYKKQIGDYFAFYFDSAYYHQRFV